MLATLGLSLLLPFALRAQDGPPAAAAKEESSGASRSFSNLFPTEAPVGSVACSLDGRLVAWSSRDPVQGAPDAVLVEAKTGRSIVHWLLGDATVAPGEPESRTPVTALAFSADGKKLAIGRSSGQVDLFETERGDRLQSLGLQGEGDVDGSSSGSSSGSPFGRAIGSVRGLAFTLGGSELAVCGESFEDHERTLEGVRELNSRMDGAKRLTLWSLESGTLARDLGPVREALQIAGAPDGRTLALVGTWKAEQELETGVILWDVESGEASRRLSFPASGQDASVAYSPDGSFLLARVESASDAGMKQQVAGIDARTCTVLWQRTLEKITRPIAVHEEGGQNFGIVITGDGSLVYLDGTSGDTLLALRSQTATGGGRVTCMSAAKRGCFFVLGGESADGKGSLEVLDLSGDQ